MDSNNIGDEYIPLFETSRTRSYKGRVIYRCFVITWFLGIVMILIYRVIHMPKQGESGRFPCLGLLVSELWFAFYWVLTQSSRWELIFRRPFTDTLRLTHADDELPRVDVFVCTADLIIEPPLMVVNTVLSVMAYDYPPEKLSVYLSDDAGSELTFYAMLEAVRFSFHWLPYCRKFKLETRSPAVYFASQPDHPENVAFASIRKLYEDMAEKISRSTQLGKLITEDVVILQHKGFSKWNSDHSSPRDHDTILQILIDGRDKDSEGIVLPTLVYLAREKRTQYHHNFKAGAMNALIRVSSEISKGEIILNVDCDMHSNSSQTIRESLCFFMDEKHGPEFAYVQFPQSFSNITKNELYGSLRAIGCVKKNIPTNLNYNFSHLLRLICVMTVCGIQVEFHGMENYGGPMYVGSGCFHRRDTLCGRQFDKKSCNKWKTDHQPDDHLSTEEHLEELEERVKGLASCVFEVNTQWGNEIGVRYGCAVEDVLTGLSIHCRGWKSVYCNPKRAAFLGFQVTSLEQVLVQHNRWSEGDFQIFLSKNNPFILGFRKISFVLQMGYCVFLLWAANTLPLLYYTLVPSLFLLKGISLFPKVSSPWFIPFAYVIMARYTYSLFEFLYSGGTGRGWLNDQRIWLYKRTSAYLLAFVDTILSKIGLSELKFVVSSKVWDEESRERYEKEIMEFGRENSMFIILASLAIINLVCFVTWLLNTMFLGYCEEGLEMQIGLCGTLVWINWPLYEGIFFRKDKGKMAFSVTTKSVVFSVFVCTCFGFLSS